MRVLKVSFPDNALAELDSFLKHEKKARLFRRAQAVKSVVQGTPAKRVARFFNFTYSALLRWIRRFEKKGIEGLMDLKRQGRPKKVTQEVEPFLLKLMDSDPRAYGSIYSMWTASQLIEVLKKQKGISLSKRTIGRILKKMTLPSTDQQSSSRPIQRKSKKPEKRLKNSTV